MLIAKLHRRRIKLSWICYYRRRCNGRSNKRKIENKIVEAFNYLPTTENIALMSIADRQKFLVSNAVIEKLVNLLSSSNTEEIEINDEVRGLKDIKGQNIRISESIYKEFHGHL